MTTDYIVNLKGNTSDLEKVLKKAEGSIKRLSDDEVLIKLAYDGNLKGFNKTFDKVLKACPELSIQFQYEVNKKLLEQEVHKLDGVSQLSMDIDTGAASGKIKEMVSSIQSLWDSAAGEKELFSAVKQLLQYANTVESLGFNVSRRDFDIIEDVADEYESVSKLVSENEKNPIKLFDVDENTLKNIEKTKENIKGLEENIEKLKKQGASDLSENDEFKKLSDEVKILRSDLDDMKVQMESLSGEAFEEMAASAERLENKLSAALERIKELENQKINPNNISFHVGDLDLSKPDRWKAESMNRVIQNMNAGDFATGNVENGDFGYGILGTGVYHTSKAIDGKLDLSLSKRNPKGYAIDISKYNLLVAKTNEEAGRLLEFLSKLQGYIVAQGSGYDGWDDVLKGINTETLYSRFVSAFGETAMDIKEFDSFVNSMVAEVAEMAKFGFDETGNLNLSGTKYDHADTPVTKLLKKLGYEGVSLKGLYYDGYEQGNTIFNLHPEDIIKTFDTQEQLDDYWQRNEASIEKFNTAAAQALGDAGQSIITLTQYVKELNEQLELLSSRVKTLEDLGVVTQAAEGMAEAGVRGIQEGQDSNSPSKDTGKEGDNFVEGFVNHIEDGVDDAKKAADDLASSAVDELNKGISGGPPRNIELNLDYSGVAKQLQEDFAKQAFNADIENTNLGKINQLLVESHQLMQKEVDDIVEATQAQVTQVTLANQFGDAIKEYTEGLDRASDNAEELQESLKAAMDVTKSAEGGSSLELLDDLHTYEAELAEGYREAEAEREKVLKKTKEFNEAIIDAENKRQKKEKESAEKSKKAAEEAQEAQQKAAEKTISSLSKQAEKYLDSSKYSQQVNNDAQDLLNIFEKLSSQDIINEEDIEAATQAFEQLKKEASLATGKAVNPNKLSNIINEIDKYSKKYSGLSDKTKASLDALIQAMKEAPNDEVFKALYRDFLNIQQAARDAGEETQTSFKRIGDRLKDMNAKFIAQFFSIQDIIRYVRELAGAVVELDSALTELRKVSDASTERLQQSFEKSAITAQELGSTISDVINITSDWARLGYDVDAAEELARVTTLFKTVGDNMTADDASSYLVSTMQGFQIAAGQAETIVDKYNQVANNFAIDTKGIGEALQRSAASFNAANTDLSKSIALITATNEVVQNPESVGTLWKTMSARIRGAKTELEDLGEEEDDFTKTTSKLRDLVKGLTGFDIMKNENEFKDIYEIILGIGKEWDKLTDIEQASLGEALAGKRNANALFAVLGNLDTLQDAYKEAEKASGSAAREQENYAKSIQYSLDRWNAAIEKISYDLLDSKFVKQIVEGGVSILEVLDKIIDKIDSMPALLSAAASAFALFKSGGIGINLNNQDGNWFSLFGNTVGGSLFTKEQTAEITAFAEAYKECGIASQAWRQTMTDASDTSRMFVYNALQMRQSADDITQSMKKGISVGNQFSGSIKKVSSAFLSFAANAAIVLAISAIVQVIDKCISAEEELAQKTKSLADEYSNSNDELGEYKEKISALYDVINDSNSSYEETKEAREQLLGVQDELISKYGNEQGAIKDVTDAIDGQVAALDRLSKKKWDQLFTETNLGTDFKVFGVQLGGLVDWVNSRGGYYKDKTSKIIDKMSNVSSYNPYINEFGTLSKFGSGARGSGISLTSQDVKLLQELTKSYEDLNFVYDETHKSYELVGSDMHQFETDLTTLQAQISHYDSSDGLNKFLTRTLTNVHSLNESYGSFYDQYIVNNKIANSAEMSSAVDSIAKAVKEYEDAFSNGFSSEEEQKAAVDKLVSLWGGAMQSIESDADVVGFVERQYPEIKNMVDKWIFDVHFTSNTDGFKEEIMNALELFKDASNGYLSYEDLVSFDSLYQSGNYDSEDDRVDAYKALDIAAKQYGLTVLELIDILKEEKLVQTDAYNSLVGKYGKDNIDSLSPEDLEIALTFSDTNFGTFEALKSRIEAAKKELETPVEIDVNFNQSTFSEQVNKLDALQSAYNTFSQNVANKEPKINLDISDVEQLREDFGAIENFDFDQFELVVTADTSGAEEIQKAFDAALTAYANQKIALEGITEKNKDMVRTQLEMEGATAESAQKYVDEQLAMAQASEYASSKGLELTEVTGSQITALVRLGEITPEVGKQLALLALKEQLVNYNSVDASTSIANIISLGKAAGASTKALAALAEVQAAISNAQMVLSGEIAGNKVSALKDLKFYSEYGEWLGQTMVSQIEAEAAGLDFGPSATDAGSSGGKDAGDAYVKAFEEELKALEKQRDAGIISETEFLEKYKDLIERYFKDVDGYGEEYSERMADYWDKAVSHMENVVSAIGKLLDHKIDAAQEGKDAAISALEEEKEAAQEAYQAQIDAIDEMIESLEEEKDALQDQIDAVQDQIDAINEANEARQHAMDLQKAEYELQRAMSQRTRLVYTGEVGQMRYERDESAVRDAQTGVQEAKDQLAIDELEKQIKLLEEQQELIDKQIEAYQKEQEEIQKAMEASSKYYDKLIKEQEKYWDSLIKGLEDQKSKWEELIEMKEIAEAYALVEEGMRKLGYTAEDVINDVPGAFDAFKDEWLKTLTDANAGNDDFLKGLAYVTDGAKNTLGQLTDSAGTTQEAMGKIAEATAPLADAATNITAMGTAATGAAGGVSNLKEATDGIAENLSGIDSEAFSGFDEAVDGAKEKVNELIELISGDSGIKGALDALNNPEMLNAIGTSFTELGKAIGSVATALGVSTGGGENSGEGGDNTSSRAASMSEGSEESQGSGGKGLVGAIEEIHNATKTHIGETSDAEGENAIGSFVALKTAVDNVTTAIGQGGEESEEGGDEENLSATITSLQQTTNDSLVADGENGVIGMFDDLASSIEKCASAAAELLDTIEKLKGLGFDVSRFKLGQYTGTAHPHYEGTAKLSGDWSVRDNERALVGELGQEVVIRKGKFFTVGDHGPEFMNLQRGDVVLNHLQSREILSKKNLILPKGSKTFASGTVFSPISGRNLGGMTSSLPTFSEIRQVINDQTKAIQASMESIGASVTSNNPSITVNNPSFTVSGVTGEQVMRQIEGSFEGLMLNAYQKAMS